MSEILSGINVVNIGYNLPAPLATSKLVKYGANAIKVEPPGGDPFQNICPDWYEKLITGNQIIRLDLKTIEGLQTLQTHLTICDLLITSNRPDSLSRLGISWEQIHTKYPKLCMISVIGYPPPDDDFPGHDLTYMASANLLSPPTLPKSLFADIWGAERVVQASLGLLLQRFLTGTADNDIISLANAIKELEAPMNYGLTTPDGLLGGSINRYNIYKTINGWIALAALEEKFWVKLISELGLDQSDLAKEILENIFVTQTTYYWEQWGKIRDLPIVGIVLPEEQN